MTTRPTRIRVMAAALVLGGITAVTACAAPVPAAAAGPAQPSAIAAQATVPAVIDCARKPQVRPRQYILACGDANAYLTGLHWAAWGSASAFAAGTSTFNDCTPTCTAGHFLTFPMLATLWRAEPLPAHPSQRFFTRLTIIYTGNRAYHANGKPHHLPVTVTYPLSAFGGA